MGKKAREIRVHIEVLDPDGKVEAEDTVLVDEGDDAVMGEIESAIDALCGEDDEDEEDDDGL